MSKLIKQMEMDALKSTFGGVRDLVVLSITGVNATLDHALRNNLRKKNIKLHFVKNTLARRVLQEMGLSVSPESPYWAGPSAFAWGSGSIAELSQAIDAEMKGKAGKELRDKVKIKGAIADGQEITFQQALKMPTRAQAIGRVVGMVLGVGGRLVSQITAPAAQVAGQIKSIGDKKDEAGPAEGAAAAEAPAAP
jgi:large subunit ribosomal protein L10